MQKSGVRVPLSPPPRRSKVRFAPMFFAFGRCIRRKKPPPTSLPCSFRFAQRAPFAAAFYFMMKPARVHAAASPFPRRKARRARRARRGAAGGGGKSSHACSASKVGRSASKMRRARGGVARRAGAQIEPCVQRVKSGRSASKNETGNAGAADARVFPVLLYTGINRLPNRTYRCDEWQVSRTTQKQRLIKAYYDNYPSLLEIAVSVVGSPDAAYDVLQILPSGFLK